MHLDLRFCNSAVSSSAARASEKAPPEQDAPLPEATERPCLAEDMEAVVTPGDPARAIRSTRRTRIRGRSCRRCAVP
jgi:hypothetical protein